MKRPRSSLTGGVALAVTLLMLGTLSPTPAVSGREETGGHRGFMAAKGRVTYSAYCSNCHGAGGTGNGNLARYLTVSPSDLTRLAIENDGQFPAELVRQAIDGRKEVRGHGSQDMPVWGDVFQDSLSEPAPNTEETGEERAQRKVAELVLYLETIQQEGASSPQGEE
jgi:mono/diheme cytochrome c family protein